VSAVCGLFAAESPSPSPSPESVSFIDQIRGHTPASITGNPAAVDANPGTGALGRLLQIPEKTGVRIGGIWLGDSNGLLSGGANPGTWSFNSLLIVGANLDAEKLIGWKGASFGIQFLQFNGQQINGKNTNGLAGSVQGYNNLPGSDPLNRSELYQLWYRQSFFNDRIVIRVGKQVPTFDFNNVARPVSTQDEVLSIPSVTGLLYTPVFVNPTLLGAIGGYYNSVSGVCISVAPTENTYLRYGFYDGNVANNVQTGMTGPQFNGYTFNIWEGGVDWVIADRYPGNFGTGLWYQSGTLQAPNGVTQNGTGGYYMFGSQRIWSNQPAAATSTSQKNSELKDKVVIPAKEHQNASISTFFQYGVNNSQTLPVNDYFGMGFTGFGLVPHRPSDSVGIGMSWAWLNPNQVNRSSELMFQAYYQAHLVGGVFFQPAISYIPTPGADANLGGAWALTFRLAMLF
ncbi:MAG: carbohydrate porin, partial [Chthoniobacterales bacterium]